MVKFLVIGLGIFIVYKLVANDFLHKKTQNTAQDQKVRDKKVAAGELVKDPACGTYVSIDESITVRDGENIHHFCSYECRDKFLKELQEGGRELPEGLKKEEDDN